MGRVCDLVLAETAGTQEPFVYGSLGGANVALVSPGPGGSLDEATGRSDAKAARDYELAAKLGTKEAWDAFLAAHPTGFHAELAQGYGGRSLRRHKLSLRPPQLARTKGTRSRRNVSKNHGYQAYGPLLTWVSTALHPDYPLSRRPRGYLRIVGRSLCLGEVVRDLQVDPKARVGAEIPAQAQGGIGCDAAPLAHDLAQAIGRDADGLGQRACAHAERLQIFLAQHLAGMGTDSNAHGFALSDSPRSPRRRDLCRSTQSTRATGR